MAQGDVAVPAAITLSEGMITCEKQAPGAGALALQVAVGGAGNGPGAGEGPAGSGVTTLRTCLLPERRAPYLLTLELARHALLMLLNKQEEWALFTASADEPAIRGVEQAGELFTAALVASGVGAGGYTLGAERAAWRALDAAVAAGERLALLHAQSQHRRRASGELARIAAHPPPALAVTDHEARRGRAALLGAPGVALTESPKIGARVSTGLFSAELCELAAGSLDFITVPMRWVEMEPTEGKYAFAATDRWIEWAVTRARLPVQAGPLIDLHPRSIPEFMYIWEHDYETLLDVCLEHVRTLVTRYRRTVQTWVVCSAVQCGSGLRLSPEQAMDLTRKAVLLTRKLHPQGRVIVEVAQPWGEYTAGPRGGRAVPPMAYVELMGQMQVNPDALGVRVQMGQAEGGRSARGLMDLAAMLDRLAEFDRPIAVTALGAPSREGPVPIAAEALTPGHWRSGWTPQVQAEWLGRVGGLMASMPYVQSVCWQDLYEPDASAGPVNGPGAAGAPEMAWGGLASASGVAKPALEALRRLRASLRGNAAVLAGLE
ncbi:MAG: hypothetical protein C0475_02055 [Planctomyces sp.]|nr:hypothetical protein [Planctomyces sp.]